jgi:hypothetical protein
MLSACRHAGCPGLGHRCGALQCRAALRLHPGGVRRLHAPLPWAGALLQLIAWTTCIAAASRQALATQAGHLGQHNQRRHVCQLPVLSYPSMHCTTVHCSRLWHLSGQQEQQPMPSAGPVSSAQRLQHSPFFLHTRPRRTRRSWAASTGTWRRWRRRSCTRRRAPPG